MLSDKSRLQRPLRTILHAVRQIVIGQSAHGCCGSKHSQGPGLRIGQISRTSLLPWPRPPDDWPLEACGGGDMYTSHPFTVGLRRVLKEPRERAEGAGSEGRGGRKSSPGKQVWTFPPPFSGSVRAEEGHRLLLRGEGGRSRTQVRRFYQLEWPWRARARRAHAQAVEPGSAPRHRGARRHTGAACPPSFGC